ncbi:TRAP transporter small permease [Saccharomonospora sp. CUA-673]|uniref:TRAP transporter small permease n=1 Tax=Saccharomonospora sp. CUA-673 TaxID=1904969 RepID=UPI0013010BE5|nr:TRAP transporter small permease [Saccharomonospora sp. CUA-673]
MTATDSTTTPAGTAHRGAGRVVDHVLGALAASCLVAIVLLLFTNASLRSLADRPLPWIEEIVTGLMLWVTMFGFVLGVRKRESIAVRTFVARLPARVHVAVRIGTELVAAAALLHLAWFSLQYLIDFGGDVTPYLGLPVGFFTAAIPVGAVAGVLTILFGLRTVRPAVLDERAEVSS